LGRVRAEIRDSIKAFADKLIAGLGENLKSITVVGSSLTGDFLPRQSDINTVLVLDKQNPDNLKTLARMAKSMSKRHVAVPLIMTDGYIQRSRDVFGVEFLDFQLIHETILGNDPFENLTFAKKDVRLQCERELKAMLIRLRQGYIAAGAKKQLVRDVLISTARGLIPLLRAILWLKEQQRPREALSVLAGAEGVLSVNTQGLAAARKWRCEKLRPNDSELTKTFESVYETIDRIAVIVDELEV